MLVLTLIMATPCAATEFNLTDNTDARNRHISSGLLSFSGSMALYTLGVKPEYAAVVSFASTAAIEHLAHKGRHGLTRSELMMIGTGSASAYVLQKTADYFEVQNPLRVEW